MKKKRARIQVLDSDSESSSSESSHGASSEEDDESVAADSGKDHGKYKIPKMAKAGPWSKTQIEGFKQTWPHLVYMDEALLATATLKELASLGRSRVSQSKVVTARLSRNYDAISKRPVTVETGTDDCTGQVHSSRFLRGFVGDPQELWIQARAVVGSEGLVPITNYELVSSGIGDLLTPKVWEEAHQPGSRLLTIQMLSTKSVEAALRFPDKSEAPKPFDTLQDFKLAVATLETAIQRIMPWNLSFRTLSLFLVMNDFGASDLGGKNSKLDLLSSFVNEILLANARAWEERRKFLSHQSLCGKWSAFLNRNQGSLRGEQNPRKQTKNSRPSQGNGDGKPRLPKWVCKKFNLGDCPEKGDRHESYWDSTFILKHLCSKLGADGRFCFQAHSEKDHK